MKARSQNAGRQKFFWKASRNGHRIAIHGMISAVFHYPSDLLSRLFYVRNCLLSKPDPAVMKVSPARGARRPKNEREAKEAALAGEDRVSERRANYVHSSVSPPQIPFCLQQSYQRVTAGRKVALWKDASGLEVIKASAPWADQLRGFAPNGPGESLLN